MLKPSSEVIEAPEITREYSRIEFPHPTHCGCRIWTKSSVPKKIMEYYNEKVICGFLFQEK